MPNIENNTMSTFTIGGNTYQVEDTSARSNIQTINTILDTKADTSDMLNYALKSEIPTITNDFTNDYKNKVDSLWEDYQDALTALG